MRIALVADLHGNKPATLALEKDLELTRPDAIWCLGDVVGKGPSSDFTCDWAFKHCELILAGNWDLGAASRRFWMDSFYWNQLGEKRMARLSELPLEREVNWCGRRIRLFHGRPIMEQLITIGDDASVIDPLFKDGEGGRYDVVIYADSHRQALRTLTPGMLINVGSVGNALGEPRCCYAILEGEETAAGGDNESGDARRIPFEIRFRQVDYDREAAIADAQAAEGLKLADSYIREIRTGLYSRGNI